MERSFQRATPASEADATIPSESWLFAQAILGNPIPDPQTVAKRAQAEREQLQWLATFSPRHEAQLRQLLQEEAAAQGPSNPWAPAPSSAQEAWDPSKHPRQGGPPNAGWFATTGNSGGASGGSRHSDFDSESSDVVDPEPTADMLALAHAWWQTNQLLQQSHHDIERLPARIASERNQLGTGGRYAYLHVQNLAQAKRDLANAKAAIPGLAQQLRDLEQLYRDSGYHKIPYSAWTPAETLIGGVGIQAVGRAVANAGTPAGLRSTGIEFDVAMGAPAVLQLGKTLLRKAMARAAAKLEARVDAYVATLPRINTRTDTAAYLYEIKHTGRYNYRISGGGVKFEIDGYRGTTILDAKHIGKPAISPYVPSSSCSDHIRNKVLGKTRGELERIRAIIDSGTTPFKSLEIITNNLESKSLFEGLLKEMKIRGSVRFEP